MQSVTYIFNIYYNLTIIYIQLTSKNLLTLSKLCRYIL